MQNKFCKKIFLLEMILCLMMISFACEDKGPSVMIDENYLDEIMKERAQKDSSMIAEEHSPFKRSPAIQFSPLKYYDPDPRYIFKSKLHRYEKSDTVFVLGTKGEYRVAIIEGYLGFNFDGSDYKINVYKSHTRSGEFYYSIWFTDKTTGYETYGVGRYIDFEMEADPEYNYTLDFNKAYNPYCAYNSAYTCPIPREEDHLDLAIEAGEKNFH